jgi:excisionase family DNA binding protein
LLTIRAIVKVALIYLLTLSGGGCCMNQDLVSIKEMARKINVPVSWLYSRTRTGEIPHFKVGKYVRFDPEKVMRWIENQNPKDE